MIAALVLLATGRQDAVCSNPPDSLYYHICILWGYTCDMFFPWFDPATFAIPSYAGDISCDFLTRALRSTDAISERNWVVSFEYKPIDGAGVFSDGVVIRCKYKGMSPKGVRWDGDPQNTVFFCKFTRRDFETRALTTAIGHTRNEFNYYEYLAKDSPQRVPKCHYKAFAPYTGRGLLILEFVNAQFGDWLEPIKQDKCIKIVQQLAAWEAKYWNFDQKATEYKWVSFVGDRGDEHHPQSASKIVESFPRFFEFCDENGVTIPRDVKKILSFLGTDDGDNLKTLVDHFGGKTPNMPYTLMHHDWHSENMFFNYKKDREMVDVGVVDFQLCAGASPSFDLPWLFWLSVSGNITPEQERECLQGYYDALINLTDASKYEYWASFKNFYDTYRVLLSIPLAMCASLTSTAPRDGIAAKKALKVTRNIIAHCVRNDTLEACKTFVEKLQSGYKLTINVEALEEKMDEQMEEKMDEDGGEAGATTTKQELELVEPIRKFSEDVIVDMGEQDTARAEMAVGLSPRQGGLSVKVPETTQDEAGLPPSKQEISKQASDDSLTTKEKEISCPPSPMPSPAEPPINDENAPPGKI